MQREKGSVKKNFVFQFSYQVLTMILPLITAPYVSRVLGAQNIGIYSYTYTIVNYFVIFAMLGLNNHGSRAIAKVKDDQDILNVTFSSLLSLHMIWTVLVALAYIWYVLFCSNEYRIYLIVQGIYLIAALLDINWAFFGLELFKVTVVRNTAIKLLTIAAIFTFVKTDNDLIKYIVVMALGTLVSQSVVWFFIRREIRFVKPDLSIIANNIKPMVALFVAVLATSLYRTVDKIMLGEMSTMVQVGCYENADKLIMFPVALINALGTVMLPRMSNIYAKQNKENAIHYLSGTMEYAVTMGSAIAFGLAAIAPNFSVLFFGEEFALTGSILSGLCVTIWLMSFNSVIRMQYIIPHNKDSIYICAVCVAAVVNFVINGMLIPYYEAMGAVIGTISSYIVIFMIQTVSVCKDLPIGDFLKKAAVPALIGLIMYLIVRKIGFFVGVNVIGLLFQIGVGIVTYCLLFGIYVYKNKNSIFHKYIHISRYFSR